MPRARLGPRRPSSAALVAVIAAMAASLVACAPQHSVLGPGASVTSAARVGVARHLVMRGETVSGLARRYGVSQRDVIDANLLDAPYHLRVGQVLRIPPPSLDYAEATPGERRVRRGETLSSIARGLGVSLTDLSAANPGLDPNRIRAGQTIRLPDDEPTRVASISPPPRRPGAAIRVAPIPAPIGAELARAPEPAAGPPAARSGGGFMWPVDGRIIRRFGSSPNGQRMDGVEIAAPFGEPIYAAERGVVAAVADGHDLWGSIILLKHADGWATAYMHASSTHVREGETVERGQMIARVGSSGRVARPLLHFEIRRGVEAVDPESALASAIGAAGSG